MMRHNMTGNNMPGNMMGRGPVRAGNSFIFSLTLFSLLFSLSLLPCSSSLSLPFSYNRFSRPLSSLITRAGTRASHGWRWVRPKRTATEGNNATNTGIRSKGTTTATGRGSTPLGQRIAYHLIYPSSNLLSFTLNSVALIIRAHRQIHVNIYRLLCQSGLW